MDSNPSNGPWELGSWIIRRAEGFQDPSSQPIPSAMRPNGASCAAAKSRRDSFQNSRAGTDFWIAIVPFHWAVVVVGVGGGGGGPRVRWSCRASLVDVS